MKMSKCASPAARLLAAGLMIGFAAGCTPAAPKGPKTYPVKGKVAYKDGKPYGPGMIEFRSKTQPHNASGEIQADGSFTLNTMTEREKLPGAVEGECQVSLTPAQPADRATRKGPLPMPITLPKPYTVKPQENDFTITLNTPKR